ncbi:hypothetical protein QE152_g10274 [Popillia japonica]|uniref:Uncharacterized protein n=1 Tax=Popillia japonica TaxID=7064 RepID=A0AAW1LVJ1_POPJA
MRIAEDTTSKQSFKDQKINACKMKKWSILTERFLESVPNWLQFCSETNIWRASYIRAVPVRVSKTSTIALGRKRHQNGKRKDIEGAVPVRVSKTSTIALGRKRDQNGKRKDIEACKQQGQGPAKKAIDGKKSS